MKSYTIATKQVPAIWLQETETGIVYHNDNSWPQCRDAELRYTTWQEAIQKAIDDCGMIGDIEYAIRDLGPWRIGPDTSYTWSIVNGSTVVKIGPIGGYTNYFDSAIHECCHRNAKVHGIKLPEGY